MIAMNAHLSSTTLGRLATAAGATWAAVAVLQITHSDELSGTGVETTIQHVALSGFTLALLLTAFGYLGLARYAQTATPARLVMAALVALSIAATASNIHGEDYSWFPVVAGPANLAWLADRSGSQCRCAVQARYRPRSPTCCRCCRSWRFHLRSRAA